MAFGLAALVVTDGPCDLRRTAAWSPASCWPRWHARASGSSCPPRSDSEWLMVRTLAAVRAGPPRPGRRVPHLVPPGRPQRARYLRCATDARGRARCPAIGPAWYSVTDSARSSASPQQGSSSSPGFSPRAPSPLAQGRLAPRAIAIVAGIVLQYALTAFARAQLYGGMIDYTDYTRYTYISGILALVGLGRRRASSSCPTAGRRRLAMLAALGSWAAVGLVTNVGLLVLGRDLFLDRADMTRALVTVALAPDRPGRRRS